MNSNLISITPDAERDPEGSKLYRVLEATLACSRIRSLRERLLTFVAASSIPVWAVAIRPGFLPHVVRDLALGTWAAGCVALSASWIAGLRWELRLSRDLEEPNSQQGNP